jgi:hypothetical protein
MKLATHLQLVPRLRAYGAIPPLQHTSSWSGTTLSTQGLYLLLIYIYVFIQQSPVLLATGKSMISGFIATTSAQLEDS